MVELNKLNDFGWSDFWANQAEPFRLKGLEPARVINKDKDLWSIRMNAGKKTAAIDPLSPTDAPVPGDWIIVKPNQLPESPLTIQHILPRRSRLSSHEVGADRQEIILGANIDKIWFVHGLDVALNLNRIERYLEVARQSNAIPELVLTKSDRVSDLDSILNKIQSTAPNLQLRPVNSKNRESVRLLLDGFRKGETLCVVGPTDAGKTTLINALVSQGRKTELHSKDAFGLVQLSGGACLLDSQGIRDLRIWIMEEGLEDAFPDLDALAKQCRFKDCGHMLEPGCAVIAAVEVGTLDRQRLKNFRKLQADAARERQGQDNEVPSAGPSLWDNIKKRMKGK